MGYQVLKKAPNVLPRLSLIKEETENFEQPLF